MEPWFDITSEDDPFTGFEDPLSYTWLEDTVAPHFWVSQEEETVLSEAWNLEPLPFCPAGPNSTNPDQVESWLQRTVSNSQISDASVAPAIDGSTPNSSGVSRNTSNSSLQSLASSANSFNKRGRKIKDGYLCNHCEERFDLPSKLNHHEKKHTPKNERPYPCNTCDERFLYPKDLRRHARRKHLGCTEGLQDRYIESSMTRSENGSKQDLASRIEQTLIIGAENHAPPDAIETEPAVHLLGTEELRMMPRKKRKAKHGLADDRQTVDDDSTELGRPIVRQDDVRKTGTAPKPTAIPCVLASKDIHTQELMDRKQRTKVWLKSASVLFQESKDLPAPLRDIFLHSLDTMVQNVDALVVDQEASMTGRVEARAALSAVLEYFKRSDQRLATQEESMLSHLFEKLRI